VHAGYPKQELFVLIEQAFAAHIYLKCLLMVRRSLLFPWIAAVTAACTGCRQTASVAGEATRERHRGRLPPPMAGQA
jgi:hypothetical protein